MNTYRLRVEGPLHREREPVADAISTLGGKVVSVDLREVDGPRAVDEIVVELPIDLDGGTLTSALEDDPEATLLSSHGCERDEPARHARNWAERSREHDLSTKLEVHVRCLRHG